MSNTLSFAPLSDDGLARHAIRRLRATQIQYRNELEVRLEDLLGAYQDDYEGRSLSPGSIDVLVTFLNASLHFRRPRVSATPSGDLYAEWTGPGSMMLGARFMESGVQYVIFGL